MLLFVFCLNSVYESLIRKYFRTLISQQSSTTSVQPAESINARTQKHKGTFGKYYDYHRRDIAADKVDCLNVEDPDVFSHRAWELEYQKKQEIQRNQPARSKKRSHDMEL